MDKAAVALCFELLMLVLVLRTIYKRPQIQLLKPLLALSIVGTLVEILSLLSLGDKPILPNTTNIYTYPALTLVEFWCIMWFASNFTRERKSLVAYCILFTALWVVAKLTIEPFYRFNIEKGKMEYPIDSTTFSILCLATLIVVGSSARSVLRAAIERGSFYGLGWIFTGLGVYAFLSLTIPAMRPMMPPHIRENMWWINTAAFAIKSVCISLGLINMSRKYSRSVVEFVNDVQLIKTIEE